MATGFINNLPLRKTRVSNVKKGARPAKRLILTVTVIGLMTAVISIGGPAAHGTPPGENGTIVFSADDGTGFDLYAIEPDGTNLRRLTNVDGEANTPDWSTDGGRIALELFVPSAGGGAEDHVAVAVMNADGSNLLELTPTGFQGQPAFTPDGDHLLYECDCQPQGVFIMNDDGTDRHRVTTHKFPFEPDSDPNVSPDGQTVTFVRNKVQGELQALFAVDIDGSNLRKIAPYTLEVAIKHDWAPDGRRIVITTNADYPGGRSPNVATIRPDGSHLRMLTSYTGGKRGAFAGSYSPDGNWIVFRVENLDHERFALFKIRPDGSDRTLIARMPFAPRHIDWGPLSDA
jgi:Tol biopolymer transport system component